MPGDWERAVERWREFNRVHKTELPDLVAPDDDDEYLFYQSVLAIWPPAVHEPPSSARPCRRSATRRHHRGELHRIRLTLLPESWHRQIAISRFGL